MCAQQAHWEVSRKIPTPAVTPHIATVRLTINIEISTFIVTWDQLYSEISHIPNFTPLQDETYKCVPTKHIAISEKIPTPGVRPHILTMRLPIYNRLSTLMVTQIPQV